jgi:hypothetical protein
LSHTKLYDLSIDLSSCNPIPTYPSSDSDSNPDPISISISDNAPPQPAQTPLLVQGQAIIYQTTPTSQHPILADYTFADIPLYKLLSVTSPTSSSLGATKGDWWITFYNLLDQVYNLCAGVCEYAVGRGQIGAISLSEGQGQGRVRGQGSGDGDGEEEGDSLLQNEDSIDEVSKEGRRGQMILRQLYHHSYHLHLLLDAVVTPGQVIAMGQVRELTGKWFVNADDHKFWLDLARRWQEVEVQA